jgi:hypothetical protein
MAYQLVKSNEGKKKKKRKLFRKQSIVEKRAQKLEATEYNRERRAKHKAGTLDPSELGPSNANKMRNKKADEQHKRKVALARKLKKAGVHARVAKFAASPPKSSPLDRYKKKKK